MARFTLRLPESLHEILAERAQEEGVSMNQYLLYTLTKAAAIESASAQRAKFDALRTRFSPDEAEEALSDLLSLRK